VRNTAEVREEMLGKHTLKQEEVSINRTEDLYKFYDRAVG
jgi:hypothetical protein